jgi:hypothetical protein
LDAWQLLGERFPFESELAEVPALNRRFGLTGDVAFDASLRPSFLVGDISGQPEVLLIGLKPGLSSDTNKAFQREREALIGSFEDYRASRTNYFLSSALNSNHYRPTAKAAATVRGEPFPRRLGEYLHSNSVQAELIPFFAPRAGLDAKGFRRLHETSGGGRLAAQVIDALLHERPWKAILVRYRLTFDTFCAVRGLVSRDNRAELRTNGRAVPVVGLIGRYPSDAGILGLSGAVIPAGVGSTPRGRPEPESDSGSFGELREYILALGNDVGPRPQRKNGTFVFRRRRNFVTLIPQSRGLKIDVLTAQGFQDGVRVLPMGIGLSEAQRLIRRGYDLAD